MHEPTRTGTDLHRHQRSVPSQFTSEPNTGAAGAASVPVFNTHINIRLKNKKEMSFKTFGDNDSKEHLRMFL